MQSYPTFSLILLLQRRKSLHLLRPGLGSTWSGDWIRLREFGIDLLLFPRGLWNLQVADVNVQLLWQKEGGSTSLKSYAQ